jgi:hypothetical protein
MKAGKISRRIFYIFGIILGTILGLLSKREIPLATSTTGSIFDISFINYWFRLENLFLIILLFFFLELLFAVLLKKPHRVLGMSIGLLVTPFIWGLLAEYPLVFDPLSRVLLFVLFSSAGLISMLLPWLILVIFSISIPYIVGVDSSAIEKGILLPDAFAFSYKPITNQEKNILDIIAHRMGFFYEWNRDYENTELSYYTKNGLSMGIVQKMNKNNAEVIFSFFSIENDEVATYDNKSEIADYKLQVRSLLRAHVNENGVSETDVLEENLKMLAKGFGRKEVPSLNQLRKWGREFPKAHPYWFSLVVIGGIVVELVRIGLNG